MTKNKEIYKQTCFKIWFDVELSKYICRSNKFLNIKNYEIFQKKTINILIQILNPIFLKD